MRKKKSKVKPYKVKPSEVLECEMLSIVIDRHHGTTIMMKTEYDGMFFVGLNKKFYLWKHQSPPEFANNPHDWTDVKE